MSGNSPYHLVLPAGSGLSGGSRPFLSSTPWGRYSCGCKIGFDAPESCDSSSEYLQDPHLEDRQISQHQRYIHRTVHSDAPAHDKVHWVGATLISSYDIKLPNCTNCIRPAISWESAKVLVAQLGFLYTLHHLLCDVDRSPGFCKALKVCTEL